MYLTAFCVNIFLFINRNALEFSCRRIHSGM